MKRYLLFSLAAMLFGISGAMAEFADDTLWTKNLRPDYIVEADFTPDGSQVIAATHGGLFFFDTATGELIRKFDKPYVTYGKILSARFSEKSTKVLLDNGMLGYVIWDYVLGDTVKVTKGTDMSVSKGRNVLYSAGSSFYIDGIDFETGELIETKHNTSLSYDFANSYASYNGQYILLTCHRKVTDTYFEHYVKLFDWDNNIVYEIPQYWGDSVAFIRSVEFTQDGKLIAIGGEDGIVRVYDLTQNIDIGSGKLSKGILFSFDTDNINLIVKFSTDNKYLFASINDNPNFYVEIYDLSTFHKIKTIDYGINYLNSYNNEKFILGNQYILNLLNNNIFNSIEEPMPDTILYPNPTSNIVNISYDANAAETTKIVISNNNGEELAVLYNTILEQGNHTFTWDASNFPSGNYWCKISTPSKALSYKIIVIK